MLNSKFWSTYGKSTESSVWPLYSSTPDCLICDAKGFVSTEVDLYHNDVRVDEDQMLSTLSYPYFTRIMYIIDSPTAEDIGTYTCRAGMESTSVDAILTEPLVIDLQSEVNVSY